MEGTGCCNFDLDGTLSTLREGWDTIMTESMVEFITGDAIDSITAEERKSIKNQIEKLIEHTTGVQTVIQMKEMLRLAEEYGCRKERLLTAHQYRTLCR